MRNSNAEPSLYLNGNSEPPIGSASSVPSCIYCGEWDFSPSVEVYEQFDILVCEDCADQAFEDNGQFGVGA